MNKTPDYIVVIGASAGGFTALYELFAHIDPEMNAAYLVVLHLSTRNVGGFLAHRLQEHTKLKCVLAMDSTPLRQGYVYVAQPNCHLMVSKEEVKLGYGATENRWRPSIDILFRSAAVHFASAAIGVVLTGLLNDGTTGMSAIKRSGGRTIVQDPNEAEYPDMPLSVLNHLQVDYCVPLSEIGAALKEITSKPSVAEQEVPDDLKAEVKIAEGIVTDIDTAQKWGEPSVYTCPDCGGVLFEHNQDVITRFKCHTGHSFSVRDYLKKQVEEFESSIWYAIRGLEQRRKLLLSLSEKYAKIGSSGIANDYTHRATEAEKHIANLKDVLTNTVNKPQEEEES